MANDADETVWPGAGDIYVAPVGTTAPTNATGTPAAGFIQLGHVLPDGVGLTDNKTLEVLRAWSSFYVLRRRITERDFSLVFSLLQWNYETVKLAFGGGTVTGTSPNYHYTPPDPEEIDERSLILDALDDDRIYRFYIPRGMVTETGEIRLGKTNASELPLTFAVNGESGVAPWELFVSDAAFSAT